jgi:hypothetical protein
LKEGVDVVIGTPGRVAHLVEVGKLETRDLLAVVVDECDVLLGDSFEFAEQVRPLKEACETQGGCFTRFVLVTATIPEDVLRQLRAFFDGSLKVLQGPGLHRPAAGLLERLVDCSGGDVVDDQSGFYRKYRALEQLLDAEREKGEAAAKRMLLFCNKIETCRRVENLLRRSDREGKTLVPLPYHAALTRERREASLGEFLVPPKKGDVPADACVHGQGEPRPRRELRQARRPLRLPQRPVGVRPKGRENREGRARNGGGVGARPREAGQARQGNHEEEHEGGPRREHAAVLTRRRGGERGWGEWGGEEWSRTGRCYKTRVVSELSSFF